MNSPPPSLCSPSTRATTRRYYCLPVARQVARAFSLRRRLERGEFDDFATMSRALGFTRARITQQMDLLLVAPEVLFLELPAGA